MLAYNSKLEKGMYYDEKEKKHKYVASDWYEFDEEKEKNIYLYVCGKKLKKE